MKEIPSALYHYTSVDSLAMILSTKTIRLSPLSTLDDLQEEKTKDISQIGKTVFISSWSEDPQESIPMWNMYSRMESGVRIKAESNLFEPITMVDNKAEISGYSLLSEERHLWPPQLNKVIYTNDVSKIIPQIVRNKYTWSHQELGVYKSRVWEFQKEWRYIVRVSPGKKYEDDHDDANAIYNKFSANIESYIYLNIKPEIFENLEVTLSPKISKGNRVIVETLKEKFCPELQINESDLSDCIR